MLLTMIILVAILLNKLAYLHTIKYFIFTSLYHLMVVFKIVLHVFAIYFSLGIIALLKIAKVCYMNQIDKKVHKTLMIWVMTTFISVFLFQCFVKYYTP